MLNTAKNNDKDFLKDKYKDEKRFRSIAMITDLPTGKNIKKKKGALFVTPLFEAGLIVELKYITVVTSLVNTCKTETAITGTDSKACNYVDVTKDLFNHLDGQIGELSESQNCKYKKEDFDYVGNFFKGIKDDIPHEPQDLDNIARGIYESKGLETDLPGTLERVNPQNLKVWAFAFDGYNDSDRAQIVDDGDNRNPVQVFFGNKIHSQNGSDLRSLIGRDQFRTINDCLMKKLGDKDFSREKRNASKLEGYKYYLSYFVQSVLQLVLVDNQCVLNSMQIDLIGENWLKFLSDLKSNLKDKSKSDLFDQYEYDESEVKEHPKKFVSFMLNKLLGSELLKELGIGDNEFAQYALAADGFSESAAGADHANQIIVGAFNNNCSRKLTYDNSLVILQNGFVYSPLWSAYKPMRQDTKNKLKLLAFQLKHKKIDFNQDVMEKVDEYRFGRPQELEHNDKDNPQKITGIKYHAPKYYDTDISPEELMDLVLEIKEITEKFNTKFSDYQQKSKNSGLQEEDISGLLGLLCDAAETGITLTDGQDDSQLEFVCKNEAIMKKLCDLLTDTSDKNLDREKYEILYKWLVNEHNKAIALMNREFCHFEFIGDTRLCDFYDSFDADADDERANFILKLNKKHSLLKDKSFVEKIDCEVISSMFSIDAATANEILKVIVALLDEDLVKSIDFVKWNLDKETKENIIFCRYRDLEFDQIKIIDFSQLDIRCARLVLLHFIDTGSKIPKEFLTGCPLEILKELTIKQFFNLMATNEQKILQERKDYLQSLYMEDLFTHCKDSKNLALMKRFFDQYADCLSDEQLLSIRGECFSIDQTLEKKVMTVREKSDLNKNIGQIMVFFSSNDIKESELLNILAEINKRSENGFKEVMEHLFKNCRTYYNVIDQILLAIRNDQTGIRDLIHKILLSDVPNENKKYINYLNLSRLKLAINQMANKKFLAYLSGGQINDIQLGSKNISYENLKNIINGFGSRISHRQLEKLIEDYNKTELKDADSDDAKQRLIKIVLISNIICDKEKSFEKNYGQMFDNINNLKEDEFGYGGLVGYTSQIAFATDDERSDYIDACKQFNYDNDNDTDVDKKTNYAEIKMSLDALNQNIQQRENELKKENADKNAIKEIDMKIGEEIKQLSAKLSSSIKQIRNDIKDPLKKTQELFNKLANAHLNFRAKEKEINELKETVKPYKNIIDQIKIKIRALEEPFIKFKQDRTGWYDIFKNRFFDVLKQLDTKKVKKTMQGITVEFEKLLNNDNGSNLLSPLLTLETDGNKIKNDENLEQMESKKTFQEFFMDNFIEIQCTGKHRTENHYDPNFTTEQKGNLGIVNVLQADECEKVENKTKSSLGQYTPEYVLSNLPFILTNCHVGRENLDQAMRELNLHNLTLKALKKDGKKQSLEKFVDSPLLTNSNWYFEAVKKLFCDHADNIYAEANLILEKDGKNKFQTSNTRRIQSQFHMDLREFLRSTTEERLIERKRDSNGNQVETMDKKIIVEVDPKSIYNSMKSINLERFCFFCGDWMCASKAFCSSENFLSDFKSYVRERIDFGVDRGLEKKENFNEKYHLKAPAYNSLIGLTLFSGFINQGTEIKDGIIVEICSLLTSKGQNEKFSSSCMNLVFNCYMAISNSRNLNATSEKIIKYMINHKQEDVTPQSVMWAYRDISKDNKGFILECVSSAYPNTSPLDILEVAFSTDCKFLEGITKHSLNVTPDFFNKIMQEITTQLDKSPEFIERREDLLSKFFKLWNDEEPNGVIEKSFIDWLDKVSSKKSIEAIIKIFSNLDNLQLKQKVFEAIVVACSENKKLGAGTLFDALSMFEKCSYYNLNSHFWQQRQEFKAEFIDQYVMDAIKNYPGEIGEAEIKNLEYFLAVCTINKPEDTNEDWRKIKSHWLKVAIEKFPKDSLSSFMFEKLVGKNLSIMSIRETKKLTVILKESGIQWLLFREDHHDCWLDEDVRLDLYLENAKKMFSRPFDFSLDDYIANLGEDDLASENQRMIFLNLCCSEDKNGKKFDFDKFVKYIPKRSLGGTEINYIGDLLWLTNKRKIDLATIKTLVEISSDVYGLEKLLKLSYQIKGQCKTWNIDANAKQFLNKEIESCMSEDIEKIWLDGFDAKKCPENLLSYSKPIINTYNYNDKNVYVIVDSLYRLNKLQGKDKIDIGLDVMKKMCNINVDLPIITKAFTLDYPRYYNKVFQLSQEAIKYLNERIKNEKNIDVQLQKVEEDVKLLKSEGISEIINKFTKAEITKIFSKTMEKLCNVSFDLDELKKIIADNNIAISADAKKTLESKMAARKETREKLGSILSKESGSLKNEKDINELLSLLLKSDGREINLDRMKQLINISGNLVYLENILSKLLKGLDSEYPCEYWEISDEAKKYLEDAVKQYKVVRRNEALDERITKGKSSEGDIRTLAKYYREVGDTKIGLEEIKKLCCITESIENLSYIRYCFSHDDMRLEADAEKYINQQIKEKAQSAINEWSKADTKQLPSYYDLVEILKCFYYTGVTEIDLEMMKQLCKTSSDLSNLQYLENLEDLVCCFLRYFLLY